MRRLTLAIGLAAGYVLGARAGRERYEQIAKAVRSFKGRPAVVEARSKAKGAMGAGVSTVTAKIGFGAGRRNKKTKKDKPVIDGTG